ncbi:hypothetical protein DE4381_03875 [Mycobacterium marinum]|nr:hypothetical protein DE4381_03875 [Mycobacterium marinum]
MLWSWMRRFSASHISTVSAINKLSRPLAMSRW